MTVIWFPIVESIPVMTCTADTFPVQASEIKDSVRSVFLADVAKGD